MSKKQVKELVAKLHEAQQKAADVITQNASYEKMENKTPDGFAVKDTLRMWVHHYWTHHRDLVRARGPLTDDNAHFHVPHFIRQANEEFGKFVGELSCLSDEQLDLKVGERTIREVVEHVLGCVEGYIPEQVEVGCKKD